MNRFAGGLLVATLLGSAAAQTELQYWDFYVTQGPAIDEIIAAFEAQNPDIDVVKNTVAVTSYDQSLDLAMQSGSGPDVFVKKNVPTGLQDYVNQGYAYDLSQFGDVEAFKQGFPNPESDFVEGSNTFGGKLYSAPFSGPPKPWAQLYVNTDLYREAGLVDEGGNPVLPETWSEFLENSRVIAETTDAYGTGFSLQQAWAAGWWYNVCSYSDVPFDSPEAGFDFRTGEYAFATNPCYGMVLKDLKAIADEGLVHPATLGLAIDDEGARAAFAEGEFAHLVGGEWVIAGWEQTHPDFTAYTATHLPFPAESPQGYFRQALGGELFMVNAETENSEAAWAFFKFLHSPEAGAIWAENGNGLVYNTPEPYDEYATNDAFRYIFNSSDLVRTMPEPRVRTPALAEVQATLVGPSPDDILVGVLTGQIEDVDAALEDLSARKLEALQVGVADAQAAGLEVSLDDYIFEDWVPTEDYLTEAR